MKRPPHFTDADWIGFTPAERNLLAQQYDRGRERAIRELMRDRTQQPAMAAPLTRPGHVSESLWNKLTPGEQEFENAAQPPALRPNDDVAVPAQTTARGAGFTAPWGSKRNKSTFGNSALFALAWVMLLVNMLQPMLLDTPPRPTAEVFAE